MTTTAEAMPSTIPAEPPIGVPVSQMRPGPSGQTPNMQARGTRTAPRRAAASVHRAHRQVKQAVSNTINQATTQTTAVGGTLADLGRGSHISPVGSKKIVFFGMACIAGVAYWRTWQPVPAGAKAPGLAQPLAGAAVVGVVGLVVADFAPQLAAWFVILMVVSSLLNNPALAKFNLPSQVGKVFAKQGSGSVSGGA